MLPRSGLKRPYLEREDGDEGEDRISQPRFTARSRQPNDAVQENGTVWRTKAKPLAAYR
jgi:hypothetical protein